jgi:hypothetical protein
MCPVTAVAMDSVAAQAHRCEVCAWTLRPGTDLEQHNTGLIHRTLMEAFARLTADKFQEFRDAVILNGRKKGKSRLKQELRGAASSQVSLFFGIDILSFDASFLSHHIVFCQGQPLQPLALALWEEPRPLVTREQDALETPEEPFGTLSKRPRSHSAPS